MQETLIAKNIIKQLIAFLDRSPESIRNDVKRKRLTFENYNLLLEVVGADEEDVSFFQRKVLDSLRKAISILDVRPKKLLQIAKDKIHKEAEIGATEGVAKQLSTFAASTLNKLISLLAVGLILLNIILGSKLAISCVYYILWVILLSGLCFAISETFFSQYASFIPWASLLFTSLTFLGTSKLKLKEAVSLIVNRLKENKIVVVSLIGFTITSIGAYILMASKKYATFLGDLKEKWRISFNKVD